MSDFKAIMKQLAKPFPADVIDWKPGATNRDKSKALGLAYVEVRHYIARLNEVVGENWHDEFQFLAADGGLVACGLTINGVTRWDIGEKGSADANTATSAVAQAFKRACVKFGLGAHLYHMGSAWVPYDAQRKRFTDAGLASLRNLASRELGGNSKPAPAPASEPEPKEEGGTNGDGSVPTSPAELYAYVNQCVDVPYNSLTHLFNSVKKEAGGTYSWPKVSDLDGWASAKKLAIAHAEAKLHKAEETPAQEEIPF